MQRPHDLPHTDPGLQITQSALDHIHCAISKAGNKPIGIRVGVRKAGCSGYEYVLEYAYDQGKSAESAADYTFTDNRVTVLVDKAIYLKFFKGGTVMDFKKEGLKEGFHFDNPNVGHQCGCGESFTLNDE